jgi:hypothetical protein
MNERRIGRRGDAEMEAKFRVKSLRDRGGKPTKNNKL